MLFYEIIETLRSVCQIDVISENNDTEITDIQFLDPHQKNTRADVLYYCNNSQLLKTLPSHCIITNTVETNGQDTSGKSLARVSAEDFGSAFNTAKRVIDNSKRGGFYEYMMRTLDRVRSVDELIDIASQSFGASLVLIDSDFRILSYSTRIPVTDKLWQKNIEQGFCDYEFIMQVRALKSVHAQIQDSSATPVEVSCPSSPFQKFSCRVKCHDMMVGFLIVIEDYDSYRPEHVEMLRVLSGVCGYAVMKYAPQYLYMTTEYHHLLYNLIIGAKPSQFPESLNNLAFPSEMLLFYCRATGDRSAFPQEGPLSDALTLVAPGCHVVSQRDNAVIVGSTDILQKIGVIYSQFPERSKTKIGISLPFKNVYELKTHYEEAADAFEIGQELDPENRFYAFEDYGIYVMFKTVAERDNLSRYLHPALAKIAEYDEANAGNLTETLHTYLKHACNTTDTAAALFLHRNSVIYRLHRIEELCDIDLNDTDTRFRLRLSYAIANVIERKRVWQGKIHPRFEK